MWLFYFLFWTAVRAREEPLYGKIGDKTLLTPDSVVKPIYTIAWKHGPSNAIEWFWYEDKTFSHQQFKDRGSLNTSTGALTITGLTPDDSGNYTVEINNKVTSKTQLLVISPVSKPTLSLWCEPEMTYCVLTCNGDTTGAEPVTYWWTSGDITWSSTKEHNITKENQEPWFKCTFKNPVSLNSSEKVFNPFIIFVVDLTWIYILIAVFGVILVGGIIISIYLMYKGRKREAAVRNWQEFLKKWDKGDADERRRQEYLQWKKKEYLERLAEGDDDEWRRQEYLGWLDKGEATERKWQEYLEEKRYGAAERARQEYLQWKKKAFLKRLAEGDDDERRWQEYLEWRREGDDAESEWQEYLEEEREGAAERARQEFFKRLDKVKSKNSEINKTSTQDLETAESPDTSNETERPASLVVVQEMSPQDTTSTGPPETSKETEMSVLLPPVENTSTQDPTSVVTQDPSNETEKSPMITDDLDTRC